MTTTTSSFERLNPSAVYLSPTGRFCRFTPLPGSVRDPHTSYATFVYCARDAQPSPGTLADAFILSAANFHLLRRLW